MSGSFTGMEDAHLYSEGFRQLAVEFDELKTKVMQKVEAFRKRVETYDQPPAPQMSKVELEQWSFARLILGNKLREIAGRKQIRLVAERRKDIEDLLHDPQQAATLFQKHEDGRCAQSAADKPGRLIIEAFKSGILKRPPSLWLALKTQEALLSVAGNPKRIWTSVVIPCLKQEYEDRIASADDCLPLLAESREACAVLAKLVRGGGVPIRRRRGRRKIDLTPLDKQIVAAWRTGEYKTFAALAKTFHKTEHYVSKLLDRNREPNKKKPTE